MNFLSPEDIFNGSRRKSLCNGMILSLSSNKTNQTDSPVPLSSKKKDRRRGSLSEPTGGRRGSLVSRYSRHFHAKTISTT